MYKYTIFIEKIRLCKNIKKNQQQQLRIPITGHVEQIIGGMRWWRRSINEIVKLIIVGVIAIMICHIISYGCGATDRRGVAI